jgi:hypothetical protein
MTLALGAFMHRARASLAAALKLGWPGWLAHGRLLVHTDDSKHSKHSTPLTL